MVSRRNPLSENGNWRNWAIVFVLLIVFGAATALWSSNTPDISLFGGNRVDIPDVPVEVMPIELDIPIVSLPGGERTIGGQHLEFSPFLGIGVLTGIIVGLVVLAGLGITFLNTFLVRQVTAVATNPDVQERQSVLAQRETDRLKQMQAGRAAHPIPDHNRPRWSIISTSLLILLFVAFFGMIINDTFIPNGEYVLERANGVTEVVSSASRVVGGLVIAALLVLIAVFRPQKIAAVDQTDGAGIPWDSIAVVFTGLLVVGIGVAAMVYLGS
jgi:hypothetical protein